MDLIKEIAKDKLVVMVTHNPKLAHDYADRIIEFKDGEIVSDTNPLENKEVYSKYSLRKTGMSYLTALKLSGTNIKTKLGRTLLTAFASSIGIIGIAIILSLSNGFDKQIANFEAGTLSTFPIMINQYSTEVDPEMMKEQQRNILGISKDEDAYPNDKVVHPIVPVEEKVKHTNIFTDEYLKYIEKMDPKLVAGLSYTRELRINLLKN
jgi:ABC-type multidrug transport system ATPase subunit